MKTHNHTLHSFMATAFLGMLALLGVTSAYAGNWADAGNRAISWGANYSSASSFIINTPQELAQFAYMVNAGNSFSGKTVTLAANLTMSAHFWTPVGNNGTTTRRFMGNFNGNDRTITGIKTDPLTYIQYAGLFGYIGTSGKVQSVKLDKAFIISFTGDTAYAGGIAGYSCGSIINCEVAGVVNSIGLSLPFFPTDWKDALATGISAVIKISFDLPDYVFSFAGGVVGYNKGGTISNCSNNGRVNAIAYTTLASAGGITGFNENGMVEGCRNDGKIKAFSTDIIFELYDEIHWAISLGVTFRIIDEILLNEILGDGVEALVGKIFDESVKKFYSAIPSLSVKGVANIAYAGGITGMNTTINDVGGVVRCTNNGTVDCDASTMSSISEIIDLIKTVIAAVQIAGGNATALGNITITIKAIFVDSYSGGVAGWNNGIIDDCQNAVGVDARCYNMDFASILAYCELPSYTGGIVGCDANGTIRNCSNRGGINAKAENVIITPFSGGDVIAHAGGVAGLKEAGSVRNCENSGKVYAYSKTDTLGFSTACAYAGGVVGILEGSGTIENCMSRGAVFAEYGYPWARIGRAAGAGVWFAGVGGLFFAAGAEAALIEATFDDDKGGLVGVNKDSTVENSYWKKNNSSGFKHNATGKNKGTQKTCFYFDTAPGTLSGTTFGTKNLKDALNGWASSKNALTINKDEYLHWSVAEENWLEGGYPFHAQPVPVTFNGNGGTPVSTNTVQTYGEKYILPPAPSLDNHSFKGWFTASAGGSQKTTADTVVQSTPHPLYAQWSPGCTIVTDASSGGAVVGNATIFAGQSWTVTAIPEPDCVFVNWTTENGVQVSTDASYTFTVTTPLTLTANFKPLDIEFFGDGSDGNLTVSNGTNDICIIESDKGKKSVITAVKGSITSGSKSITVESVSGIEKGDEILIYIAQETNTLMSSNYAGRHQFNRVADVSVSNKTLTVEDAMQFFFAISSRSPKIQVIRVPNYNDVVVKAKGTLTCKGWNGATGGVVAFRARTLTVESGGTIDVSTKGYKGGDQRAAPHNIAGWGTRERAWGMRGENVSNRPTGWAGSSTSSMNGGGAGRGQGGGGGGGNATAGGGGEEHSNGDDVGGQGGAVTSQKLVFGGGGGSGGTFSWNNAVVNGWADGGPGGRGGGCVFIGAKEINLDNGRSSVKAEGENGWGYSNGNSHNGGGGGAGGSVYLMSRSSNDWNRINVGGGVGGSATSGGNTGDNKNGGKGGEGHVSFTNPPPATTGLFTATDGTSAAHVALTWVNSSYAISYKIYRSTSNNSGSATQIKTGVSGTSYNDTSAVAGTTYYYWVKATNPAGDSVFSNGDSGYRAVTYSVKYNGNGQNGGSMIDSSHVYNVTNNLSTNLFTKIGHSFIGWATTASGSVVYTNAQSVINLVPQNGQGTIFNLFAQWGANTYKVTLLGVGAEDSSSIKTVTYGLPYGDALSPEPEREGYRFAGWFTDVSSGTLVTASTLVTITSDLVLYARWVEINAKNSWEHESNRENSWGTSYLLSDPIYIGTPEELAEFAWLLNNSTTVNGFAGKTVTVTNDLDMSAYYWTPAGINSTRAFKGILDGRGHLIRGITIDDVNTLQYAGLFGYVNGGTVENVNLVDTEILLAYKGDMVYAGGVAGANNGGLIGNCTHDGMISVFSSGDACVGGLVGYNYGNGVTISNCLNNGVVESFTYSVSDVGGIVGWNNGDGSDKRSIVERCFNYAEVFSFSCSGSNPGSGSTSGGIVGYNNKGCAINQCANNGFVSGAAVTYFVAYIGGIAGDNAGTVKNCQNNGAVTAFDDAEPNYYAGGVAGRNSGTGSNIQNCHNRGEVSASYYVGGLVGWNNTSIVNCMNRGEVNASSTALAIGGLVGLHDSGEMLNCYWKRDGSDGFSNNYNDVGSNINGAVRRTIRTFTSAPGTLDGSVTVGVTTITGLLAASNAWVAEKAASDDASYSGWTTDGSPDGYPVLACFDYYVRVLLDTQGGTVSLMSVSAVIGKTYDLPEPEREGHAFEGWFTEPGGAGTLIDNSTIIEPPTDDEDTLVLYAYWTQTHTLGSPVLVPYSWLDQWINDITDYEKLALEEGVNKMTFWESYVAGLNPTNAASRFVASIDMRNGHQYISWTPDYEHAQGAKRRFYSVEGKTNLTDHAWHFPTNDATRFFRVKVKLAE